MCRSSWSGQAKWLPFGAPHSITGSASLDARFPGQWFQIESGLHYNWHRHYDPSIGRYTQPDPLRFVDGPSVYAYAKGSPQVNVDFADMEIGDHPPMPKGYNSQTWHKTLLQTYRGPTPALIDPRG